MIKSNFCRADAANAAQTSAATVIAAVSAIRALTRAKRRATSLMSLSTTKGRFAAAQDGTIPPAPLPQPRSRTDRGGVAKPAIVRLTSPAKR
jgi:hypothetical protein